MTPPVPFHNLTFIIPCCFRIGRTLGALSILPSPLGTPTYGRLVFGSGSPATKGHISLGNSPKTKHENMLM